MSEQLMPAANRSQRTVGVLRRVAARIPTYVSDIRENPAWLPMFLLARTMPFRRAHWMTARRVPAGSGAGSSLFGDAVTASDAAAALRTDGFCRGLNLPPAVHEEIAGFARSTPCFANFDRQLEFLAPEHQVAEKQFGRSILSGHFFERSMECAAVRAVQQDPLLLGIAQRYLGGQATLATTRIWWTFPTKNVTVADLHLTSLNLHFDLDDWRMLKFFFYISDVGEEDGAHVYVLGSHRKRALKHQYTLLVGHPVDEVLRIYGAENRVTMTGKAGTGFVEDPFGFHMGSVPRKNPRLMMEIAYGVSRPSARRFHGEPVLRKTGTALNSQTSG
ncbi:hypothetical protein MesoLjLc_32150 [Mesorhizobium sp. L-8-10]|uniref:phytanoyl-CoA dioxygenase family protein n=1 Tax=Mesorhizobium sp. L-8-10 TaxID=2744523 RepID=UPI0019354D8C|nr:phytanoyl-CoA dioxygenase family protein [Mesorhizobium sp. L-8-10]BCH31285.1 hypothetical protein MesoLjLc_32150 [Mesorhizobium sp. L-8-10]